MEHTEAMLEPHHYSKLKEVITAYQKHSSYAATDPAYRFAGLIKFLRHRTHL